MKFSCIRCYIANAPPKPAVDSGARMVFELYAGTITDGLYWYFSAVIGELQLLLTLSPSNLQRSDPTVYNNQALTVASECGHVSVVSRLLEQNRVDPYCCEQLCYSLGYCWGSFVCGESLVGGTLVGPLSAKHNRCFIEGHRLKCAHSRASILDNNIFFDFKL
eukprot:GILJ01013675.1.p1 GENE.GILJ01013675.1~~GILJ01013675.1.p1  ORF type:complete len:163 (+),score=11.96 GILJ01013675.1:100-588(+)